MVASVNSLPSSPVEVNIFDSLPTEIWECIFKFACIDGGRTGRSLALVSRRCHELSKSTRYYSLILKRARQLVQLVEKMRFGDEPIGQIHHLFVGLGDLFFDLVESEEDAEDEDYVFSGTEGSDCSDDESQNEDGSVSRAHDISDSRDEEAIHLGEYAEGTPNASATSAYDDADDEEVQADIFSDLAWLRTSEGQLRTPLITDITHSTLHSEYTTRETECLQLLYQLLSSPSCIDCLESLTLHINFKNRLQLADVAPPLPALKRLAIHSRQNVVRVDLLANPTTSSALSLSDSPGGTPYFPSLHSLRLSGVWMNWAKPRTWTDIFLSFITHTPQLHRVRAPMPHLIADIEKFLNPTLFSPTIRLALFELPSYPRRVFGTTGEPLASKYGAQPIERLNKRIKPIVMGDDDLDLWIARWKEEIDGKEGSWAKWRYSVLGKLE